MCEVLKGVLLWDLRCRYSVTLRRRGDGVNLSVTMTLSVSVEMLSSPPASVLKLKVRSSALTATGSPAILNTLTVFVNYQSEVV